MGRPRARGAEGFVARRWRLYGKKRGNRRTGSPAWANAGEAIFFAVMLLLGGAGALVAFVQIIVPQWRVTRHFVEVPCRVLQQRIGEKRDGATPRFRPEAQIEYAVAGETYRIWTYDWATVNDLDSSYGTDRDAAVAALAALKADAAAGAAASCWHDPANPAVAVLVRGFPWWTWLVLAVPISFIVIGGGGLIYALLTWGTSSERRALRVQRTRPSELFSGNGRGRAALPYVPPGTDIVNSPGTRMRYRLPLAGSSAWRISVLLAACVVWNASVLGVFVYGGILAGGLSPWLVAPAIPFFVVGLALVVLLVREVLVAAGIGPTRVEISDHPLQPGGHYRLFVSQSGPVRLRRLTVSLVCTEEATYRQGTDTRVERHETIRLPLVEHSGLAARRGAAFEIECDMDIPDSAMHSFQADHNRIQWAIVVAGEPIGWPEFRRGFPIVVRPAASPEASRANHHV